MKKQCRKCGVLLSANEFWKSKSSADGLHAYCKACSVRTQALWRVLNAERDFTSRASYRETHKERLAREFAMYYSKNTARLRQNYARWAKENEAHRKAYERARVEGLADGYVRAKLRRGLSIRACEIPNQLVEAKRLVLQIKREVRQK